MTDSVPPLMPDLEGWAIVSSDQVGPPCSAGKGKAQRLVARPGSSHLEVIYDVAIDRLENPTQAIAEQVNLLVMKSDPEVLRRSETCRVTLGTPA